MLKLQGSTKEVLDKYKEKDDKLVVGVSGGPDSVALLFLLVQEGFRPHVAHLNHGLRGKEADLDADFVICIAKKLQLTYTVEKRTVPKLGSLQLQARQVRYKFFQDVCANNNTNKVILAQHKDDQLETIIMNFFRGAGLSGLGGIKEVSYFEGLEIIRPLLQFTKQEIITYLKINNLSYRIDSSNNEDKYYRNKVRLQVIPFLEDQFGNGFKNSVVNNARIHNIEEEYFIKEANKILAKIDKTHLFNGYDLVLDTQLGKYHKAIIMWVLRVGIARKGTSQLRSLSSIHYEIITKSILANKPTTIELPNKTSFVRWDNNLGFYTRGDSNIQKPVLVSLNTPIKFGEYTVIVTKDCGEKPDYIIDLELATFPLYIRTRKEGDAIKLDFDGGTKKLKEIFIDKKIPKHKRDEIPLLVDKKDDIIVILGHRVNGQYYVKKSSKKIYNIYVKSEMEE